MTSATCGYPSGHERLRTRSDPGVPGDAGRGRRAAFLGRDAPWSPRPVRKKRRTAVTIRGSTTRCASRPARTERVRTDRQLTRRSSPSRARPSVVRNSWSVSKVDGGAPSSRSSTHRVGPTASMVHRLVEGLLEDHEPGDRPGECAVALERVRRATPSSSTSDSPWHATAPAADGGNWRDSSSTPGCARQWARTAVKWCSSRRRGVARVVPLTSSCSPTVRTTSRQSSSLPAKCQ